MKNLNSLSKLIVITCILTGGIFVNTNGQTPYVHDNCSDSKSDPLTAANRCRSTSGGGYNSDVESRMLALGSTAGDKKKFRSVFVSGNLNGEGGFALTKRRDNSGTDYSRHANPNTVGNTMAVDLNKNCIYEREDEFLQWAVEQEFDEIVMYNISHLLQYGHRTIKDYIHPVNSNLPFDNDMGEERTVEWHLARFIHKAKTEYNLEVVAVVPSDVSDIDYDSSFYKFHDNFTRNYWETFLEDLGEYSTEFAENYIDQYWDSPEDISYVQYGQDTLFLPEDDEGRISDIDKAVVDIFNFHVFQMRAEFGYLHSGDISSGDNCNSLPEANSCDKGFDAHLFEWEWWDNNNSGSFVDNQLYLLIGLVTHSKQLDRRHSSCNLGFYICQDHFNHPNWSGSGALLTEQQRADTVDKLADKVYLYSYHNNPCDLYNGTVSSHRNKFTTKAGLLANNNFGALNGRTQILPVFNARFKDDDKMNTLKPEYYGDINDGCYDVNMAKIDSGSCDYCNDLSGQALISLVIHGYDKKMGYVENVFQDQYDLDSPSEKDNDIVGYSWFKSNLLIFNDVISGIPETTNNFATNYVSLSPNPSNSEFNLISEEKINRIQVFSLSGALIKEYRPADIQQQITLENPETYLIKSYLTGGKINVNKIVKL